jgi:hypothetical protein
MRIDMKNKKIVFFVVVACYSVVEGRASQKQDPIISLQYRLLYNNHERTNHRMRKEGWEGRKRDLYFFSMQVIR